MSKLAEKWIHPTRFTGEYPHKFAGYTWLDWSKEAGCYHPADDYNYLSGDSDCGQDCLLVGNGLIVHISEKDTGYGKIVIAKHRIGYNLKRLIQQTYGVETDVLYSLYAHLQKINCKVGDELDCGAIIAKVGKTGTKVCHLHGELYHLEGELKNVSYRFYPIGWSAEKVKENWLPLYSFIELSKQVESVVDNFLGKSKDYWLQVEKDRENMMKELGDSDKKFLKIQTDLVERAEKAENADKQCQKDSANKDGLLGKAVKTTQSLKEKIKDNDEVWKEKLKNCQIRITELLKEQSSKYTWLESLRMAFYAIFRRGGEKNEK